MRQRIVIRKGEEERTLWVGVLYPVTQDGMQCWLDYQRPGWLAVRADPDFLPSYKDARERDRHLARLGYSTSEEWYIHGLEEAET